MASKHQGGPAAGKEKYMDVGERTAARHRHLQNKAEGKMKGEKGSAPPKESGGSGAVQDPGRKRPASPLPKQHQDKPGVESKLKPRPMYSADTYQGSEKLLNQAAIITGADSGIGRATAVLFAREGADVAIVYLNEHSDAEETRQAVEAEGRKALLIPGDVTDPEFCRDAVAQAMDTFGRLDILVNNAAFQEHAEALEDISEEQFDQTLKTNLYGYFYMAKAALPYLKEGCSIINTGSVTGILGSGSLLDYSITKGGIHAFTKSLAQSLVKKGIRVNAVAPGPVWTPLNPSDQEAEKVAQFGSSVPMQRPAQPEEIAPSYVFLAAPSMSSYITGAVIPVLGGETVG
jgi:NAD(P)-dependent dehydrogenase (short-subunit alcohol dehydrogenase family)